MATMSLATTTATTYSPSAKYGLITLTSIPTSSRSDNGGHTRNSLHLYATPDKAKRCFSMSFNPTTASVTKLKPTSSSPHDPRSHRSSVNILSSVPQRRQHRTTYGQNFPSLPLIKANTLRHITKNGHKKTHSIQLGRLADNLSSHALVQSPLQQSHVIDWTVDAQAREIETEPESPSCVTCEDYVYMAPCEHHPSKGQTEYLINDIFPKLTVSIPQHIYQPWLELELSTQPRCSSFPRYEIRYHGRVRVDQFIGAKIEHWE